MDKSELQRALRFSEVRYRRLFEAAQDGILLLNAETAQIEDVNPFLVKLLGYSHAEFLGKTLWEIGAFKDTALSIDAFVELRAKRYIRYDNLPLETKDGRRISVEFVSNLYDCDGIDVIQCNIRDNTKRHLAEIALAATARALRMLSEGNVAMLNSTSEQTLLSEYCRIAVETGGYRMAWIGFAGEGPDKPVSPMAHYGVEDGYLSAADISWAENERGSGPVGRAIRDRTIQVVEDIATDPAMAPWQDAALKRGYRSAIAVPITISGGTTACMTLYGATCDVWSTPERKLLQELSADLGFGVSALRVAFARTQTEERLRVSLEQTIQVVADTIAERDSYTAGHQRRVAGICSKIAVELGLSVERIRGLHLAATIHDLGKIGVPAEILSKPRRLTMEEFSLIRAHPTIGFEIVKAVDFPWPIAQIILQHHERIDGTGYPVGLTGDAMLLESRILAVADVVEAMASHRPYRSALGIEAALDEISAHRGTAFDADVVDACLRIFRDKGYEIEA
ncbi:MAG: HD domain-containing phosphohydrolase [Betaproteobacteria bacterium]